MSDKLAHYELLTPIGAGGMGEVYRARDTRLDREVAIKILPEALAKDPERIARFDREAKTLASLTHPNIATVHDFMTDGGTSFLVMELVEGEDLSERLEAGALDAEEARQIAIQLATGLEAAHERNIVHRDLKPANIKITPDGKVKILDFGLARAVTGDPDDQSDPLLSPTITQAMTQAGTILGTAAYMSPEQARGKTVDKRADIWAFGVLLYEMLTGERLFEGETTSDTLASVLKNPVDFDQLGDAVPNDVQWVLQRCLDRNPTRRLRDIGEARLVLSGESTISQMGVAAAPDGQPVRRSLVWPAIALVLAAGLAASFLLRPGVPEAPLYRVAVPLPDGVSMFLDARQPGPPQISPDGHAVVFSGQDVEGNISLWYRRLDSADARKLDGTGGASYPFWSPDSRSIGFFADNSVWRLDIPSGSPLRLATSSFGKGGSWNADGTIVFAPSYATPLSRISARGGDLPREVTALDSAAGDNSHRHPFFLPDGQHFLYLARGAQDSTGSVANSVRVGSLDGGSSRYVTGADGHAAFHHGHLLFARDRVLVAQPFDPASFALTGDPRVILAGVDNLGDAARTAASVSLGGALVYEPPFNDASNITVTRFDRQGNAQGTIGGPGDISRVVVSPDRSRAALTLGNENLDAPSIWILDLQRGTSSRFASGSAASYSPVWSPDGKFLAYSQVTDAGARLVVRRVDGGGSPVLVHETASVAASFESWSPDGKWLSYSERFAGISIVEVDAIGSPVGEAQVLVGGSAENPAAAFGSCFIGHPDWLAYHSTASGTFELYVTHRTDATRRFQLTSTGAIFPSWNPVENEIAYAALGSDMLTVVGVEMPVDDGDPIFGMPEGLFRLPGSELDNPVSVYGEEIVIGSGPEGSQVSAPLLVTDWRRLLVD
jgi:Tol biopolymer transport system component/tRNA A-37 threonylcarbamoyl transferase component Bud32